MNIRDRIKELRRVPADQLQPNPKNWRKHPEAQANALRGVLAEVGIASAVLARETPEGGLMLIDGHLRTETLHNAEIPVLVLDVTEEEADKILATFDPLGAMAESDAGKLDELLREVNTSSEALQKMLAELAAESGLYATQNATDRDDDSGQDDAENVPPPSGVRMVQLFLDESNIGEFQDACTRLAEEYATANITDTVLEALRHAIASL